MGVKGSAFRIFQSGVKGLLMVCLEATRRPIPISANFPIPFDEAVYPRKY